MHKWRILIISTLLLCVILSGCMALTGYKEYYPQEGVWFCEELQIQLSFEDSANCCILVDGIPLYCGWQIDRGSTVIVFEVQDHHPDFSLGDNVFVGEYITHDENILHIQEYKGTTIYKFVRMDESEIIDVETPDRLEGKTD